VVVKGRTNPHITERHIEAEANKRAPDFWERASMEPHKEINMHASNAHSQHRTT
jgi:hypothetical protein